MIIDIGSGHKPDRKANILLEYGDVAGNEHRRNTPLKIDSPIIFYNTNYFPFKNKTFHKSICKHVLEHVNDPALFLKEIERISSGGYIETPSEIAELTFTPYDLHKWVVNCINKRLILKKKTEYNTGKFGKLFDYLCENEIGFENNFYWKRRALFFIEYYWDSKIDFEILPASKNTEIDLYSNTALEEICVLNNVQARRNSHFKKKNYSLIEIFNFLEKNISTPCCKASVERTERCFTCEKCARKFTIDGFEINLLI